MKGQRFERGQALVLIVLSVVAIFGFAALAVDMGRVYAERRRAQSAADAAALSAAYTIANVPEPAPGKPMEALLEEAKSSAFATALENGYSGKFEDFQAGTTDYAVVVNNPPDDDATSHYEECSCKYIQVYVYSKVNPIFMQFIGRKASDITTVAVARARFSQPISTDDAIHALITDKENGDGIMVDGNFNLEVAYGNIRSNKNGVKNGSSGQLKVDRGKIKVAKSWTGDAGNATVEQADPLVVPVPPAPDCGKGDEAKGSVDKSTGIVTPGNFDEGLTLGPGPDQWKMKSGMYCVKGDFKINGSANVYGDGVFIVMKGGSLSIDGNASVQWKRPNDLVDYSNNQWGGMLIYSMPQGDNSGDVDLTGTSGSSFMGTVFAPRGLCSYGGNSQFQTMTSFQLVCHQVKLHGNPNVTINYQNNQGYRMPPIVELVK